MNLGTLGNVSARQRYDRSPVDALAGISTWIIPIALVLLLRKNPARLQVFIISVIIYLIWILIINRFDPVSIEAFSSRFVFDAFFLWLAASVLLLPGLIKLRKHIVFITEILLAAAATGLSLYIYGTFWGIQGALLFIILFVLVALTSVNILTQIIQRSNKMTTMHIFIFSISALFLTIAALMLYTGGMYIFQIIEEYEFSFDSYYIMYYLRSSLRYTAIFYGLFIPFAVFTLKNRFYRKNLLKTNLPKEIVDTHL